MIRHSYYLLEHPAHVGAYAPRVSGFCFIMESSLLYSALDSEPIKDNGNKTS